ncbi:MAG: M48 family metalloprotease [Burkholderiales bacterium]|nr:M48 family metalloprotease [Phycisphaerae bacterium]
MGNNFKTVVLLSLMTGFILLVGQMIGGPRGVVMALVIAGIMNFAGLFFSAKIAIASMQAQEVGAGHPLYDIVEKLAQRAGLPMPRVYVAPHAAPNAFATGRGPKNAAVCATEGLMQVLDKNELAGVMAHELAHVKHRDILIQSVAATIGGAISFLGQMSLFGGMRSSDDDRDGGSPLGMIGGLLLLILGPIAAAVIQMAISRQREYAADTEGGALCGDPMHLATALEKIHVMAHRIPMDVNPAMNAMMIAEPLNLRQSMAKLFATHPPLEDRLLNLIGRESTGMRYH